MQALWLITGINGADGSHFCDLLLAKGYTNIHGIIRRSSNFNTQRLDHIFDKITLHYGDLTDAMCINNLIKTLKPDYIINFGAQSHVQVSSELENYTFQTNTLGLLNILQTVHSLSLKTKIYQASTSEQFGNHTNGDIKLSEKTEMNPVSVYGISKLAAHNLCELYKNAYGMFIVSGILFNHEGKRRGNTFVTQKIASFVGRYFSNSNEVLQLGNLNARRDWGNARIYCEAIYLMMMQENCKNYIVSSGETHSVREFVELAFKVIGIDITWKGSGLSEIGVDSNGKTCVCVNPKYYRDIDIECLIGDPSLILKELGWKYDYPFCDLVSEMVLSKLNESKRF